MYMDFVIVVVVIVSVLAMEVLPILDNGMLTILHKVLSERREKYEIFSST